MDKEGNLTATSIYIFSVLVNFYKVKSGQMR